MPELTPRDRLQPSLLDRLTDDEPDKRTESRDKRVLSMSGLQKGVLRDIGWLFNSGNLVAAVDLEELPLVADSVLNYGLPDLAGVNSADLDSGALERAVRQALLSFEPRILRHSLKVRAFVSEDLMSRNALAFVIEGELWGQPVPTRLLVRTEIDLDTGNVSVIEGAPEG